MEGEVHLDRLASYDKERCAKLLEAAGLAELWSSFLQGQATLYFDQEITWLLQEESWRGASTILELGSGDGAYLALLSDRFKEKTFLGVESQPSSVAKARARFRSPQLTFFEGDAEKLYPQYLNQFDAVFYRLTLQHLKNPKLSLALAHQYLKKGGYLFVIDSHDSAQSSSHQIHSFEKATSQLVKQGQATLKGNRLITTQILEDLENKKSPLSSLYELVRTSLDVHGKRLEKGICFESSEDRKRYFNHALLFLTILKKGYAIPVDLSEAYHELQIYLSDELSWVCPGIHFLVLKKIDSLR